MNQSPIDFSKQLVKGRIAETLFEQMLRDAGGFTILSFGYENILPELAHRQHDLQAEETMEIIRRAPDFAVIDNKNHEVHLVEVKYRNHYSESSNFKISQRMLESWKPSYLFMATPEGFYFDKVIEIVEKKGKMNKFIAFEHLTLDIQNKYLNLLNQFIPESVRHNGTYSHD